MPELLKKCREFNLRYLGGPHVPGFIWIPMIWFYLSQFYGFLCVGTIFPNGIPAEVSNVLYFWAITGTLLVMSRSSTLFFSEQEPQRWYDFPVAALTLGFMLYLSIECGFLFFKGSVELCVMVFSCNSQELVKIVLLVMISGYMVYSHNPDGYDDGRLREEEPRPNEERPVQPVGGVPKF